MVRSRSRIEYEKLHSSMKITFERSGGFANIHLKHEFDSAILPADKAKELNHLIAAARPFEQSANQLNPSGNVADQFQYTLTLDDGTRKHIIQTSDATASSELQNLISWLQDEAFSALKNKTP